MKCENETLNKLWGTFQSLPFLFVVPCFLLNCRSLPLQSSKRRGGERATDFGLSTSSHFPLSQKSTSRCNGLRRNGTSYICIATSDGSYVCPPVWPKPVENWKHASWKATTDFYKLLDSDICDLLIFKLGVWHECLYRNWDRDQILFWVRYQMIWWTGNIKYYWTVHPRVAGWTELS